MNGVLGRRRVSIISPSFNQRDFIQKTLESVAEQTTLPYEHIVLDACSTDGSVEPLKEYEERNDFARVIIEQDDGQSDAINKGFALANGDILTWLNTDDFYPNRDVLESVTGLFDAHPSVDVI